MPPDTRLPEPEPLPAYVDPASLRIKAAEALRPPRRMSVSQAAEAYMRVENKGGGYSGAFRVDQTPYLREPMDSTRRRRLIGTVFAGPAQCGKTEGLILAPIAHAVCCDPADMLVLQTNKDTARDFSIRRIAKLNRISPEIRARLVPGKGDNVFDKQYWGMMLALGGPTISNLSGRPIPRCLLTDVDRMPEDIEGEGNAFDLAVKRNETFGSRGWTLAESSPGKPILQARWKASAPHEAPPCGGILALYNRGHRARWQWPCPHCGEYFEGTFALLRWLERADPVEAAESVAMCCPVNGCVIEPRHKSAMNAAGIWVPEGQSVVAGGLVGEARRSDIASYWLKGPAAAFQTWSSLVSKWLSALAEFERTGKEEALKVTVNTDQGEAYLPKAAQVESSLEAEELIERVEDYPLGRVPAAARFLTAAVDVQQNRFEVLVRAWGPGLESWVVDVFQIFDVEDNGRRRPVDPARHPGDWDVLFDQVVDRLYPLADDPDRFIRILRVVVDSGGAAGVTARAYEFWRRAKRRRVSRRVVLYKGASTRTAPRVAMHLPDSRRKDRKAQARGEVPVLLANVDLLKDELDAQLRRAEAGPLHIHLARGLLNEAPPHDFFEQLTSEVRDQEGRWKKEKRRNEALDLMVMSHAGALQLKADRIDWSRPPDWALPQEESRQLAAATPADESDAAEGNAGPAAPRRRARRRGNWLGNW